MPFANALILPRERPRLSLTLTPEVRGVDLVCSLLGIHVAYLIISTVWVRSTIDNWLSSCLVSLMSGVSADAVPTLCADRRDNLYCFVHTGASAPFTILCMKSEDYGMMWETWNPGLSSYKFPRACCTLDAQFLVCHDGTSVVVFRSIDYFQTTTSVFSQACSLQLVDLCVDRRDTLHLIYRDGEGNLVQRISKDGYTWRSAVTVDASAEKPAGVFLHPSGNLLCFETASESSGSGPISRQPIKSEYEIPDGSSVSTGLTFPVQYFGADRDKRDNAWLAAQKADSSLWVGYMDRYAEPWHEVI